MSVLADLVGSYGLTLDEFTEELREELGRRTPGDPRALTAGERDALLAVGVSSRELDEPLPPTAVAEAAAALLDETVNTLTTTEMAAALGRSESRVRGAIADGSLLGVRIGRNWRLPAWQIHQGRPLPQLRKIIAATPDGVSPATIGKVMTTPTDELFLDGHPVTPRQWLLAGGDPNRVTAIVAALYAW